MVYRKGKNFLEIFYKLIKGFGPIFWGAIFLLLVFAYGLFIFMYIEGWPLLDSFYQVVITLSTVGFEEEHSFSEHGKFHTSILILLGVGGFAYLIGLFSEAVIEGKIQLLWGKKKMENRIQKMHGHYIVCGYGRIGSIIVRQLLQENAPTVVLEDSNELTQKLMDEKILYIQGDATDENALERAGIKRANTLITALDTDAKNLYVTLTTKRFVPDIRVIARAEKESSINKLIYAGADNALT